MPATLASFDIVRGQPDRHPHFFTSVTRGKGGPTERLDVFDVVKNPRLWSGEGPTLDTVGNPETPTAVETPKFAVVQGEQICDHGLCFK